MRRKAASSGLGENAVQSDSSFLAFVNFYLLSRAMRMGLRHHLPGDGDKKQALSNMARFLLRNFCCGRSLLSPTSRAHGPPVDTGNYLEFISRVSPHIPDKGQVTFRYRGLYANAQTLSPSSPTMPWWIESLTISSSPSLRRDRLRLRSPIRSI